MQQRDPHNLYHMMTIADVQKLAPAIDWADYFKEQGAPGVAKLNVSQPEFLKALQTELSTEDVAALRAYLRFHLLTAACASYLAQPFEQAYFDFYSTTLRGVPADAAALEDLHPRASTATWARRWARSSCAAPSPPRPRPRPS